MLEPCDAKVSRTVPRGLDDRKVVRLLGTSEFRFNRREPHQATWPLASEAREKTLFNPVVSGGSCSFGPRFVHFVWRSFDGVGSACPGHSLSLRRQNGI